jgi:hypothetical protein
MISQEIIEMYHKNNDDFLNSMESCWNGNCDGKMKAVPLLEQTVYFSEEYNGEYVRVAKCDKCGKYLSNFTLNQWIKNQFASAERTVLKGTSDKKEAKQDYIRAVEIAKREYETNIANINAKVADAMEMATKLHDAYLTAKKAIAISQKVSL